MDLKKLIFQFGIANQGASGPVYLLDDRFITDRAAGAIDGTAAEPGGTDAPTRAASDAGGKLSLSGGRGMIAAGAGANSPNLTYSQSYARAAGLILSGKGYVGAATDARYLFGWSSTENGTSYTHRAYGYGAYVGTIAGFSMLASWAYCAPYFSVVVLRASGAEHYIYGAPYGRMTLIHVDRAGTTTPLYPAWTHYSYGASGGFGDIRIPESTYVCTPLISDSFNRADGAPANDWTDRLGAAAIATNKLGFSALTDGVGLVTKDTGKTDHVTIAKLYRTAGAVGIVTRYVDNDNCVKVVHDGTNVVITPRIGGVDQAAVASAAKAYSAGADLEVIWQGTELRVLYNNSTLQDAAYTITDAALQTGTQAGIYSTDLGNTADDFECLPRGTADEHAALTALAVRKQSVPLVVFEGDSLTASQGATPVETYPYLVGEALGRTLYDGASIGIGGQKIADIVTTTPAKVDGLVGKWSKHILVIWAGTNDIDAGTTVAATYASLTTFIQARKAAGWKVIALTMIKRTTNAALETKRGEYNALIVANTAGADAVVDVGANAGLQNPADGVNYQADETHLTAAGYALVAADVAPAIPTV